MKNIINNNPRELTKQTIGGDGEVNVPIPEPIKTPEPIPEPVSRPKLSPSPSSVINATPTSSTRRLIK